MTRPGARVEVTITYNDGSLSLIEESSNGEMWDAADVLERVAGLIVGALRAVGASAVSQ